MRYKPLQGSREAASATVEKTDQPELELWTGCHCCRSRYDGSFLHIVASFNASLKQTLAIPSEATKFTHPHPKSEDRNPRNPKKALAPFRGVPWGQLVRRPFTQHILQEKTRTNDRPL